MSFERIKINNSERKRNLTRYTFGLQNVPNGRKNVHVYTASSRTVKQVDIVWPVDPRSGCNAHRMHIIQIQLLWTWMETIADFKIQKTPIKQVRKSL